MPVPPVRIEKVAIVAGVAIDLSAAVQLPTGEHVVTAAEAIQLSMQLIQAAVNCDPKCRAMIRAVNAPIHAVMLDGPLQGYDAQLETFWGLEPTFARMSCHDRIPGFFKYKSLGRKDEQGRVLYGFVQRLKEGEDI